ncbi:MAG: membrane protein insertase YidC [Proteobacteria bacterium]|nr:membrane protein insertase YidC [Pseudomonadota bacterium]
MTNFRALWWIALVFTLFMLYTEWTHFVAQKAQGNAPVEVASSAPVSSGDVPQTPVIQAASNTDLPVAPAQTTDAQTQPSEQRVQVSTDLFNIALDTKGADLRYASLKDYAVSHDDANPFTLMSDKAPYLFLAQSGFASQAGVPSPTHHDIFSTEKTQYRLAEGSSELRVPFVWEKDGVRIEKTYVFHRGSYLVSIENKVTNNSQQPWQASVYQQLVRNHYDPTSSFFLPTYTGGVLYDETNKFEKVTFDAMKKQAVSRDADHGWLGMMQHYFVAALIPSAAVQAHYYSKALDDNRYVLGMVLPAISVAPGASAETSVSLYVGPKHQDVLAKVAPGLELTADYGVLAFIAKPMFWLLETLHSLVQPISGIWSWGWAIILLTMLLKGAFYKLSAAGYKSMANLRKLAPRLQHLKDNYGHDKMMFQQKMMELYKTEKINPLGGCLPIFVQIPVFLALYWVLLEAVELRMTPFLWLNDLSHNDPFFILPILMGVTMVIQQKLNPPPTDPMQEKVMKFLPYIFTLTFLFMPSGLVLYWVVNNGLSILQQWHITRQIEAQDKPPAHHHSS